MSCYSIPVCYKNRTFFLNKAHMLRQKIATIQEENSAKLALPFLHPERQKIEILIGNIEREKDGFMSLYREQDVLVKAIENNHTAQQGCSRCDCGNKYWRNDRCIDCDTLHDPRHDN